MSLSEDQKHGVAERVDAEGLGGLWKFTRSKVLTGSKDHARQVLDLMEYGIEYWEEKHKVPSQAPVDLIETMAVMESHLSEKIERTVESGTQNTREIHGPLFRINIFWMIYANLITSGITYITEVERLIRQVNAVAQYKKVSVLGMVIFPFTNIANLAEGVNEAIRKKNLKIIPIERVFGAWGILFCMFPILTLVDFHRIVSKWNEVVDYGRLQAMKKEFDS